MAGRDQPPAPSVEGAGQEPGGSRRVADPAAASGRPRGQRILVPTAEFPDLLRATPAAVDELEGAETS